MKTINRNFTARQYSCRVLLIFPLIAFYCLCAHSVSSAVEKPEKMKLKAPESLIDKSLTFDIEKTETISGDERLIYKTGEIKQYFYESFSFIDARSHNGFSWKTNYAYSAVNSTAKINYQVELGPNNDRYSIESSSKLTFYTPTSGDFELDTRLRHSSFPEMHYIQYGNFSINNSSLKVLERGLINMSLNLDFSNVETNRVSEALEKGSRLSWYFPQKGYGNFTVGETLYETESFNLEKIGDFEELISGTLKNGDKFELKLEFIDFNTGKFDIRVGEKSLIGEGYFYISRWIPVKPYEAKGTFNQGYTFHSEVTGVDYPYAVYLPPGYTLPQERDGVKTKHYPVLYLTDGQWTQEYYKLIEQAGKEFIVVAIEQGPENRRMVDYQLPGATAYISFLKDEFIPHIDKKYSTNSRRLFWGGSLGATLGELLLSQESEGQTYFDTYIFADGAFWVNPPAVKNAIGALFSENKPQSHSVFISATRQGNYIASRDLYRFLQSLKSPSLKAEFLELQVTHPEVGTPTIEAFAEKL